MNDPWPEASDNSKRSFDVAIEAMRERLERSKVQIGPHTLYCEDAAFALSTLGKVDCVLTDPPYGIGKAEWDDEFQLNWFDVAAKITHCIAVMPGTWNLGKMPHERAGFTYKWTLSAHLVNGMTKGGFGWGNWIPCVVYKKPILKVQPEHVRAWCQIFAAWCKEQGITKKDLDRCCGTSDMGGWYLGLLPHRCTMPAQHQWEKIKREFDAPASLAPNWIDAESDYVPATDCKRFAIGFEPKPDHPSPKPLNVTKWFLETVTDGEVICDPFAGSGTTGIACIKLGRRFIGIERDPKHFATMCRRISDAMKQPDLFIEQPREKPVQTDFLAEVSA